MKGIFIPSNNKQPSKAKHEDHNRDHPSLGLDLGKSNSGGNLLLSIIKDNKPRRHSMSSLDSHTLFLQSYLNSNNNSRKNSVESCQRSASGSRRNSLMPRSPYSLLTAHADYGSASAAGATSAGGSMSNIHAIKDLHDPLANFPTGFRFCYRSDTSEKG